MFNIFKKISNKNRVFKVNEYLDTNGLKSILFPVLEKHYPQDAINILNSSDDLLFGTPYFSYIFLIQKYDYLNCTSRFKEMSLKEKMAHLIYDRGAGNDTAFTSKEKETMINTQISNYNDVILTIIDCEQSREEGGYGYPWKLGKNKFFSEITPAIENAYLKYRKIDKIE